MNEKLTIADLVDLFAIKADIPKKEAEAFLREIFVIISENISLKDTVKIKDFGTFKPVKVSARKSVDINTGKEIEIAAHYKLSFIPDKDLKDTVNKPFAHFESVLLNDKVSFPDLENKSTKPKEEKNKKKVITSMKSTIVGLASAFNKKNKEQNLNMENNNNKKEKELSETTINNEKGIIVDNKKDDDFVNEEKTEKIEQFDDNYLISRLYNVVPFGNKNNRNAEGEDKIDCAIEDISESELQPNKLHSDDEDNQDTKIENKNAELIQNMPKDKENITDENKDKDFLNEKSEEENIKFYPIIVEQGLDYSPIDVNKNTNASGAAIPESQNVQKEKQSLNTETNVDEEIQIPQHADYVEDEETSSENPTDSKSTVTTEDNSFDNSMIGEAIATAVETLEEIPTDGERSQESKPTEDANNANTSSQNDDEIWPWVRRDPESLGNDEKNNLKKEEIEPKQDINEELNNNEKVGSADNADNQVSIENQETQNQQNHSNIVDSSEDDVATEVFPSYEEESKYKPDISEQTDKDMSEMEEGRENKKASSNVLMFIMALIAIIILFLVVFFWISQKNKNTPLASEFGYENQASPSENAHNELNQENVAQFPTEETEANVAESGETATQAQTNQVATAQQAQSGTNANQQGSQQSQASSNNASEATTQPDSDNKGVNGVSLPTEITMQAGNTLRLLSEEYYGNRIFWVYIYEENKNVINNPNNLPRGVKLVIPSRSKYDIDASSQASVKKANNLQNQLYRQFP